MLIWGSQAGAVTTYTVTGTPLDVLKTSFPGFTFDFVDRDGNGLASVPEITSFTPFRSLNGATSYTSIIMLRNSSATRAAGNPSSYCNGGQLPPNQSGVLSRIAGGKGIGFGVNNGRGVVCFTGGWSFTSAATSSGGGGTGGNPVSTVPVPGAIGFALAGVVALFGFGHRRKPRMQA